METLMASTSQHDFPDLPVDYVRTSPTSCVTYGDDLHHIPCPSIPACLTFVDSIPLCVNVYFNMFHVFF